jgi:hypothetical protein
MIRRTLVMATLGIVVFASAAVAQPSLPSTFKAHAHDHQDDRVATVVSGTWYIGYGDSFDSVELRALPPGSFYTEPSNRTHFAETRDESVIVQITGVGPSSTRYVDAAADPRRGAGSR